MGREYTATGIEIVDASGSAIVDTSGVNPMYNFESGGTTASTGTDLTNTTYADISDMTLTTSNFSRARNVIILFTAQLNLDDGGNNNFDDAIDLIGNIDGDDDASMYISKRAYRSGADYTAQNVFSTHSMHLFKQLGTGTHTIKIRGKIRRTSGTATGNIYRRSLSYIALGA